MKWPGCLVLPTTSVVRDFGLKAPTIPISLTPLGATVPTDARATRELGRAETVRGIYCPGFGANLHQTDGLSAVRAPPGGNGAFGQVVRANPIPVSAERVDGAQGGGSPAGSHDVRPEPLATAAGAGRTSGHRHPHLVVPRRAGRR